MSFLPGMLAPVPTTGGEAAMDFQILEALQIGQVSFATIGVLCVIMLLSGKLITLREHKETRADRDAWRQQAIEAQDIADEALKQNSELLRGAEISVEAMRSLDVVVQRDRTRGGDSG